MTRGLRASVAFFALIANGLAGCSNPADIGRAPALSPVGTGLLAPPLGPFESARAEVPLDLPLNLPPPAGPSSINLYNDQRIARVGDILTVIISINDKATFGNSTDRSTKAKTGFSFDWAFNPATSSSSSSTGTPLTFNSDINSTSTSQGQGNIDRSEQIQLSVPAVVTHVFPNGNLLIRGSQEVQVNFELRQLTVAGIVHPSDISRNNTIAYDHVAEARISYGGRGPLSEVQQPAWGQQVYDFLKPF
jgi:flagellar L-ring protein precursor FlgH